jgi:polyisoprenoid-binding protein YceI
MRFMRLGGFLLAILASFGLGTARAEIQSFPIDPYHSQAIVLVSHYGITRMGGLLGGLTGTIEVDPETMGSWSMNVTIPVASFISTHPPRTEAVKGDLILDVANHPEIHFACQSVEKRENDFLAAGTITIRGVAKDVSFPMVVRGPRADPFGNQRTGLEGKLTVNRKDFGIPFDRKLPNGDPVLGDEVEIQFQVEALRGTSGVKAPDVSQGAKPGNSEEAKKEN